MSRWEISQHPSWDRTYASGMTVQEIADYIGRARSTVHRHIQVRETYSLDLRAVHDAAREARGTDWPTVRWQREYKAVQDFHAHHGRLPTRDDSRDLERWLTTQRLLHRRKRLPRVKVTLMQMLPSWDISPYKETLENRWRTLLAELVAFVAESGELPHWHRHTTEAERVLGVWLHIQYQARLKKTLLPHREADLDAAVPGWRSRE